MMLKNRFVNVSFITLWLICAMSGFAEARAANSIPLTQPEALSSCACLNPTIVLDATTGQAVIRPSMVIGGGCDTNTLRVVVVDDNPLNKDTVDCPGIWTYGVFDLSDNLLCWGTLTAKDLSGPLLAEVQGRCGRPVAGHAANGIQPNAFNPINPSTLVWRDTFLSTDVSKVFNNSDSWDGTGPLGGTYAFYAGGVRFEDATHYSPYCDCRTDVKITDQVTFYQCNSIVANKIWALVTRTFTATDCRGNASSVRQEIYFMRPDIPVNALAAELSLRKDVCSGTAAEMLLEFKKNYLVYTDTFSCNREKYAYFPEAVSAGTAAKLLSSNYSFDVKAAGDFAGCNGRKVQAVLSCFDWCTGAETTMDTVLLKWSDETPPTISKPSKPVVLSTGVLDCTAAFGIDQTSLNAYFGVQVADNCGSVNVSTRIESCKDSTVQGILVSGKSWRQPTYQTIVLNGRIIATGVPVGLHRLIISAFDNCNNARQDTLPFVVVDKVAPVMKCESQINITLATSKTSSNGNPGPFAIPGYAKVFASELNKGTSDNCGMKWVRIRRGYNPANLDAFLALGYDSDGDGDIDTNDGVDWNANGIIGDVEMERFEYSRTNASLLMTPALDFVEFFCGDINSGGVQVELWGMDKTTPLQGCDFPSAMGGVAFPTQSGGNTSYCWQQVQVEDKSFPEFSLPLPARMYCDSYSLLDSLSTRRTVSLGSSTYQFIENQLFTSQNLGRFEITNGNNCSDIDVQVEIVPALSSCRQGQVSLVYTAKKFLNGSMQSFAAGSVSIDVLAAHAYNLRFPADTITSCSNALDTANVLDDANSSACDVFAVSVSDKPYSATGSGADSGSCYRVYRTFTVINWCQYSEACGDPSAWSVIVPRDPAGDGMDGVQVLVRDSYVQGLLISGTEPPGRDGVEEVYFEDRKDASLGPDGFSGGGLSVDVNGIPESFERINPTNGSDGRTGSFSTNNAYTAKYPKQGANPTTSVASTVAIDFNNAQDINCPSAGNNYFAYSFTQIIQVQDVQAPEIKTDYTSLSFEQDRNTCAATVSIPFFAVDVCAAPEIQVLTNSGTTLAIQRVQLRLPSGNLVELSTVGATLTAQPVDITGSIRKNWICNAPSLPIGSYALLVVVRDNCGNLSAQKEIPFVVADKTGTSPTCFHGLTTTLTRNPTTLLGESILWATDFIASPVDDCNGQGPELGPSGKKVLKKYYIARDNGDGIWNAADGLDANGFPLEKKTFVTVGCSDMDISVVQIRIFTEDSLGNMAFCNTHAVITDPNNSCLPPVSSAAISGAILTENQIPVQGVEVGLSGTSAMTYLTDAAGEYAFAELPKGKDYTVTPYLDDNHRNGVSTFDMVLITKHILGMQPLSSPYKVIAADINNSKSVTTLDLIHLRKLILGIDVKFSNSTSWRFVPRDIQFANPLNPWQTAFSGSVNVSNLAADTTSRFVAIKVGDVNGNAIAGSTVVRTNGTQYIHTARQMLLAGETYAIPFYSSMADLDGMQFTLGLDTDALDLVDMHFKTVQEENMGIFINEGLLSVSWNRAGRSRAAVSDTLFSLILHVKKDISLEQAIQLNNRIAVGEAYRTNEEQLDIALKLDSPPVTDISATQARFELLQNIPNPFYTETYIRFYLPDAMEATLTVQDVTGRTLHTIRGNYQTGYNMVVLKAGDLSTSGVLYYSLKAGNQTATQKMILLE